MTRSPAHPPFLSTLAPSLFGDVGGHRMVVVDLRAPRAEAEPIDVIREIVDRGDAACLYDREGLVPDCVVARIEAGGNGASQSLVVFSVLPGRRLAPSGSASTR